MTAEPNMVASPSFGSQEAELTTALKRGLLFSILWLMGIGSAIAVYNGLKARRIVNASDGRRHGGFTMWWCLVVGALGILIWAPVVLVGIYNQF
ncbi:MAG: hypothetical protein ABJD11_16255 [Gemmatimonadota bacterium]